MKIVRIRGLDKPHSVKQELVMNALLIPGLLEMVVDCGTKWGKTLALSTANVQAVPIRRQAIARWIAPYYKQCMISARYMARMLPGEPYTKFNESYPSIGFPSIDTKIEFLHGQNPEAIEGEGPMSNCLDEAAKLKVQIYERVKATCLVTKAPIIMISTPNGRGWFYKKGLEAQEEMRRAKAEGRRPNKIYINAPSWDNPKVDQNALNDSFRNLPKRVFDQFYGAISSEDGNVFMHLQYAFGGEVELLDVPTYFKESHDSKAIFVGADWARKNDRTVFYAINEQGHEVGHKVMEKVEWSSQVRSLKSFCDEVVRRSTYRENQDFMIAVLHDASGIGDVVDDALRNTEFPYPLSKIEWTNFKKALYCNDLILSFEEKRLHLFPWKLSYDEHNEFGVTINDNGYSIFCAPDGGHDDTVMSLVLANFMMRENNRIIPGVGIIDTINNMVGQIHNGSFTYED